MTWNRPKAVIGTRGSKLALWQSNFIADRLRTLHPGLSVELSVIKTSGDKFQDMSLPAIGKGAFTKEIEEALLAGDVDLAVHSLKDLPTATPDGLTVWAYPARFDPRDAWIGRNGLRYTTMSDGATIATGALRRTAQVKHRFPKAKIEALRGNVDTRLKKFAEGQMSGMFLAAAGLKRLGLEAHITELLAPELFLPAPGQGALAIEGRSDLATGDLLRPLDDANTRAQVTAERSLLATLEGGCQVPIAALAQLVGDELVLDGLVADLEGDVLVRDVVRGPRAKAAVLGERLAERLLERGARQILHALRQQGG
ncbi:MAG: hydroxymethylbilane synthase [Deltaproteobacteria bacterium]|nr:hydroxymethylbilane synthase [Deltaproteobacteria bacterium]